MDYWTALVLGLAGSLHCAGMCGPLTLALPRTGRTLPGFLAGKLGYNLGRIITYCALGLLFGLFGKTLLLAGLQRTVSITLGILLLLSLLASRQLANRLPVGRLVAVLKSRLGPLLRRPGFGSQILLGLLNGLLPCSLVYVAGAGAVATGGILNGAIYMALFGVGTVPMLLAIGVSGHLASPAFRLQFTRLIPVSIILVGTLLILRGLSLGIPYLSPDLSIAHPGCCH